MAEGGRMKLLSRVLVPLTALCFAFGCGDDESPGDDGSGGRPGNDDPQCKGVYSSWTRSELEDAVKPDAACSSDAAAVCGRDLNDEAGDCGASCFPANMSDNEALAACTLACVKDRGNPDPSDACLGCYLLSVACVQMNCLAECLPDPAGTPCIECRETKGCTAAFYGCSGLPEP